MKTHFFKAFLALQKSFFHIFAFGDIADIALDHLLVINAVYIANEFNIYIFPAFCLQGHIFIPDILFVLQLKKSILASLNIFYRPDLPQFFAHKFVAWIPQHIDQIGVNINDISGVCV